MQTTEEINTVNSTVICTTCTIYSDNANGFTFFQDAKQDVCNKPDTENVESLEYVEYTLLFDRTCQNL